MLIVQGVTAFLIGRMLRLGVEPVRYSTRTPSFSKPLQLQAFTRRSGPVELLSPRTATAQTSMTSLSRFESRSPILREKIMSKHFREMRVPVQASSALRRTRIRRAHNDGARGSKREYCAILAATAANERCVVVIEFVRNVRPRFRHEFHFADEIAAPGAIHLRAKLMLHGFDLFLPGDAVGGYFKASGSAADRARVSRKRRADHRRPRACKPRQHRFRPPHPAQRAAKKCSSSFHGSGILTQGTSRLRNIKRVGPSQPIAQQARKPAARRNRSRNRLRLK